MYKKTLNRIVSLLVLAAFCCTMFPFVSFAADQPAVAVGTVSGKPGESVRVNISIVDNPGIVALRIFVKFDTQVLKLTKAENGTLFSDGNSTFGNNLDVDLYTLLWVDSTTRENMTQNGVLATLTFDILEGAAGTTPITLEVDPHSTFNVDLKEVTLAVQNGSVTMLKDAYTATFTVDGAEYSTASYKPGAAITKPADPTKEGYTFTGWSPAVPATMPAQDMTFAAQFKANSYTVTWNVDGKTTTTTVAFGAAITKPADPTKEGYIFTGWSPAVPATMPAQDMTFAAVFEKVPDPTVTIRHFTQSSKQYDYRTTITFAAEVQNAVSGGAVHWFVDGEDAGTGEQYTVREARKSFTIQAKYIVGGKERAQSDVETVNIRTGFFAWLIALFRALLGKLPVEVQEAFDFRPNLLK